MPTFSVIILTAAPPTMAIEAGGAMVKIDGREALLRSIDLFLNRDGVKQILVVIPQDEMEEAKRRFGGHFGFAGVKLVAGGDRWIEQLSHAAEKLSPDATHVIVHDGARPAVPYSDIDAILEASEKYPAVAMTTPLRTVLVEVDEGGNPMAYHLPDRFVHLLTPQSFSRAKFLELASTKRETHASEIHLLKGSPLNVRLGGQGDASMVRSLMAMLPRPKPKPSSSPFEEAQW